MEFEFGLAYLTPLLVKDANTYEHSLRVGELCRIMAPHLGLNETQTRQLIQGGYLHDIGKIGIPDEILKKEGALSREEWRIMQQHASLGARIMEGEGGIDKQVLHIIKFHHERWNGSGYPDGLRGEQIPVFARICGIIDSFDSMVTDRPYRKGMSFAEAKEELLYHSGTQFDQPYVSLFVRLLPIIEVVYQDNKILHK